MYCYITSFQCIFFVDFGKGTSSDWGHCSRQRPCSLREGDCDGDSECKDGLVCGEDNCKAIWPEAEYRADCCVTPDSVSCKANFFMKQILTSKKLKCIMYMCFFCILTPVIVNHHVFRFNACWWNTETGGEHNGWWTSSL